MENATYSQMRLQDSARSLKKLYAIYQGYKSNDPLCDGLRETAAMLEALAVAPNDCELPAAGYERRLKKVLSLNGVKLNSAYTYNCDGKKLALLLNIRTNGKGLVETACLGRVISEVMGRKMVLASGERIIINDNDNDVLFEEAPKYHVLFGNCSVSKEREVISGDSYSFINKNGKAVMALADGMGTGDAARHMSDMVVELMEHFLESGYSAETAQRLINSALVLPDKENPVTVDVSTINLHNGQATLVKSGAAASYIKTARGVKIIRPSSLPVGMIKDIQPDVSNLVLKAGDYIVMVSDGVVDALPFYDKEQRLAQIIEQCESKSPRGIAADIMDEITFFLGDKYKDDMTVLVAGIWDNCT